MHCKCKYSVLRDHRSERRSIFCIIALGLQLIVFKNMSLFFLNVANYNPDEFLLLVIASWGLMALFDIIAIIGSSLILDFISLTLLKTPIPFYKIFIVVCLGQIVEFFIFPVALKIIPSEKIGSFFILMASLFVLLSILPSILFILYSKRKNLSL